MSLNPALCTLHEPCFQAASSLSLGLFPVCFSDAPQAVFCFLSLGQVLPLPPSHSHCGVHQVLCDCPPLGAHST